MTRINQNEAARAPAARSQPPEFGPGVVLRETLLSDIGSAHGTLTRRWSSDCIHTSNTPKSRG